MNSGVVVIEQGSFDLQLFLQVGFKLCIDVLHYGLVAEEREERALSKHLLLGQHTEQHPGSFMGALHIMKTSAALGTFPVQLTIPSYQVCVFAWCTGSLLWTN